MAAQKLRRKCTAVAAGFLRHKAIRSVDANGADQTPDQGG